MNSRANADTSRPAKIFLVFKRSFANKALPRNQTTAFVLAAIQIDRGVLSGLRSVVRNVGNAVKTGEIACRLDDDH